jgi:hypothetical protein
MHLVHGGGVSFHGNWYVGEEGLTRRLRGQQVQILWDRRDIGTIYLVDADGRLLGAAHCPKYLSRRVSVWEAEAERKASKRAEALARATASENLTGIVEDAQEKGRRRAREARAAERTRFLDAQQGEIHTSEALDARSALAGAQGGATTWGANPADLPGPDDDLPEDRVVVPFVRRRARAGG